MGWDGIRCYGMVSGVMVWDTPPLPHDSSIAGPWANREDTFAWLCTNPNPSGVAWSLMEEAAFLWDVMGRCWCMRCHEIKWIHRLSQSCRNGEPRGGVSKLAIFRVGVTRRRMGWDGITITSQDKTAWTGYPMMMACSTYTREVPCIAALVMLVDRVIIDCVAIIWFWQA